MTDTTTIATIELPAGQDWAWFADLNVIGLSHRLDADGRRAAVDDILATWRRDLATLAA